MTEAQKIDQNLYELTYINIRFMLSFRINYDGLPARAFFDDLQHKK